MAGMVSYTNLWEKVQIIRDFLLRDSLDNDTQELLVILGEGGSGKSVATSVALSGYDKRDVVDVIYEYEGSRTKFSRYSKKTILHSCELDLQSIRIPLSYTDTHVVYFVKKNRII